MFLGYPVVFVPSRIETGHGPVLLLSLPHQLVHRAQQVDVALEAAGEIDPVGCVLHQINFDAHLPVQPGAAEKVVSSQSALLNQVSRTSSSWTMCVPPHRSQAVGSVSATVTCPQSEQVHAGMWCSYQSWREMH